MRAASELNFWAISPSPTHFLKDQNDIYIKKITLSGELRHIATLHSLSLLILKTWFTYQPFSNDFSIFTNWKWFFYHVLLLWIFFSALGFEPRTLHVLGKPSTHSLYPWLPCLFSDFFYTSHIYFFRRTFLFWCLCILVVIELISFRKTGLRLLFLVQLISDGALLVISGWRGTCVT